jgi:hypothetical protein
LEQRRLRAGRRFARGASQAQVAVEFGVSRQTASGAFQTGAKEVTGITLQVAQRRDGGRRARWLPGDAEPPVVPRFAVAPRRWVVERTFAWPGCYRRLSRDYQYLTATSEAVIQLAMIQLLLDQPRLFGRSSQPAWLQAVAGGEASVGLAGPGVGGRGAAALQHGP